MITLFRLFCFSFFFFLFSYSCQQVDYFGALVYAGYACVSMNHKTLTRTTGSLTCVCISLHAYADVGASVHRLSQRILVGTLHKAWISGKFAHGRRAETSTKRSPIDCGATLDCGDHAVRGPVISLYSTDFP